MADHKPEPRAAVVVRGASPGPLVVRIDGRGRHVYYLIRERDAPRSSGRVFAVVRLGAAFAYTVRMDGPNEEGPSCECLSWYTRRKCVHTGMLDGLFKAGRL